jgi:organic radical activating enzyme
LWWLSGLRAKGSTVREAGNVSQLFVSFQGEGPHTGRRQLFVRMGGCPLRCRYCDEPESLVSVDVCRILGPDGTRERPNPFTPADLDAEVEALAASAPSLQAVAVTGGEPLLQADFLAEWLVVRCCSRPPASCPRVSAACSPAWRS